SYSARITSQALARLRRSQRRPAGCFRRRSASVGPNPGGGKGTAPETPLTASYSASIRRYVSASRREKAASSSQLRSRSSHIVSWGPAGKAPCGEGGGGGEG